MNRIVLLPVGIGLLVLGLTALLSLPRPRPVQSRPGEALVVLAREGTALLELRGVAMVREGHALGYVSPATASQVEAVLTTADGRRWRAQWQEVAP